MTRKRDQELTRELEVKDQEQQALEARWVQLDLLSVSLINPRKTFDEAALRELVASVGASGILTPLLVRPTLPAPRCEIVAGHRRFEAAKIVGLFAVPCIVREMDDATAAEVALIDNLQRADVPAIEEAEALGQLLARHGTVEAVAAKAGKDVAYIAKRLKLLSLTLCVQDALRERLITVDHALLLARLGAAEQDEALKWTIDESAGSTVPVEKVIDDALARRRGVSKNDTPGVCRECGCTDEDPCRLGKGVSCSRANAEGTLCTNPECLEEAGQGERRPSHRYTWEPKSVQRLKDHIEVESGIPLSRAPWAMGEDWLLLDICSCLDCPKNTKTNAPLFADLDMGEAVCVDGACFKEKTEAFVQLQLGDAAKDLAQKLGRTSPGDVEVLRVSWKLTSTAPRQLKDGGGVNPAQVFKAGQWVEVDGKKSCEHARPAVTLDWSDSSNRGYMGREEKLRKPGEIIQVCVEPKCKVYRKTYEEVKREKNARNKPEDPASRKKSQEEQESLEKEEKQIHAKVFAAILKEVKCFDLGKVLRIVNDNDEDSGSPAVRKEVLGLFPKLPGPALEALTVFVREFSYCRRVNAYWIQSEGVAAARKDAWGLAKTVGVDADAIAAKHFHDTFTDRGDLSPWLEPLYPKTIKWPEEHRVASAPAKKGAKKTGAKPALKKAVRK